MPLPADVQICSVDDHVVEHIDAFKGRLPAKFGDRGPRIVEITGETVDPLGNVHTGTQQVWEIDGSPVPHHRAERRRRQAEGGDRPRAGALRRDAARLLRHR